MQLIDSFEPTPEQQAVIEGGLVSSCIIACPGSGKTTTAVRRVLQVCRQIQGSRGNVLLLSFSNVAVDTFRNEYQSLDKHSLDSKKARIETLDGFLANFIIRPHGARVMGCNRQPFWISGEEPFLSNFKVWDGTRPRDITNIIVQDGGSSFKYIVRENNFDTNIEHYKAEDAIKKLGKTGAYNYELGRYWAINLLIQEPKLLAALSSRFPHIIVDEAQDIGFLHECLLKLLKDAGSTITLIGDPNQAIFEFADADGRYLNDESKNAANMHFKLSENRRSLSPIVDLANQLTMTSSKAIRHPNERKNGIYYVRYDHNNIPATQNIFASILKSSKYELDEGVILCRGTAILKKLGASSKSMGVGATAFFAEAAVLRDNLNDIAESFKCIVYAVIKLIDNPEKDLIAKVVSYSNDSGSKLLRRQLWQFLRDGNIGLPPSNLKGESEWFVSLKKNVSNLLNQIESTSNYSRASTWVNRLTKSKIEDTPLYENNLVAENKNTIRIDSVHKAKGQGITAVMYLARTEDINHLLAGTQNEEGRIGYVAVTRAKDLLILGVPNSASKSVIQSIENVGFKAWNFNK